MTKKELQSQALTNATVNQSVMNYASIFAGFMARGIAEAAIRPRENVFTYNAWLALGRQVRKGEHGVKVVTFVPMSKEDKETGEKKRIGRRPWTTTVFHESQTEPAEPDATGENVPPFAGEGCGRATHVIGTNGGTLPCGATFEGKPYFCDECKAGWD